MADQARVEASQLIIRRRSHNDRRPAPRKCKEISRYIPVCVSHRLLRPPFTRRNAESVQHDDDR